MSSHNPGRSQLVAVPSSNILEKASASERVFWSSISDTVQSHTEDRTEIRTLISNIRESFAKVGEDEHPTEEVQRAHDIVVEDLRSTIVKLLSCSYKSSSVVSTTRSRSNHEHTTDQKQHRSKQSHMSEAVLQGARDIIGLRRVQLERELHELSTREAQLLHRQEHGYSGAGEHSKDVVVPGFPGPKGHQEDPGAKGFDGDQVLQGPDRVPGNLVPTGDDGMPGSKVFLTQQGDTGFSRSDGPPRFDRRQGDTRFSESDGPPGFDGLQGEPGLFGIPGSQSCTRVQGRSDFQGETGEQGFPGPDAATGETGSPGVPVVRESDGEDGRSGRTGKTGEKGNPGPQGPAGSSGDKDFELLEGGPGVNGIAKDSIVRVTRPIEFRGVLGEQGFRGNPGTVSSDGAPGVTGRRELGSVVGHTGSIGLDGDLSSTGFPGRNGLDGGIGNQRSAGATRMRDRQEPECPTERIGHPDRVGDEERQGLCGAPKRSGLVGPCGLNGLPDGRGPSGAQGFPGQRGVCGITRCVGLRGMAGRQCDTGARCLLGANGFRSVIGLPESTGYVYALKRWRQVQFDPGIFWSLWRSDYLLTLEHWHGI